MPFGVLSLSTFVISLRAVTVAVAVEQEQEDLLLEKLSSSFSLTKQVKILGVGRSFNKKENVLIHLAFSGFHHGGDFLIIFFSLAFILLVFIAQQLDNGSDKLSVLFKATRDGDDSQLQNR